MGLTGNDMPALILIDIQKGFDHVEYWGGERNNLDAEQNASQLLEFWRTNRLPVYHLRHCSTNAGSPVHETSTGNQFKDIVQPRDGETVIKKRVNSAFIGTGLYDNLINQKITKVVIVGSSTDHCVSTTARMAGNFGFDTYLVADATATFNKKGLQGQNYAAELIHETALASLHGEFATVITMDVLLKNL